MKIARKIIQIDEELCNGCGQCVPDCAEGSLQIIDGKARLVADKLCDGLGACLGSCPTGALKIIEREAEEFDEAAVEHFLATKEKEMQQAQAPAIGGCPSARLQTLQPLSPCQAANVPGVQRGSALSHWPVQIRLIPPTAPFLENCDLLVAADCTAVAYAGIQKDFLAGRVVMMGCPKFDDQQLYVDRFTEIFRTRTLKSLTILIMEVPCCHSMLQIIRQAYDAVKPDLPVRQVVISTQGAIKAESAW
jgi:NAD-dependent dihydropyrimidine dehydrogenase PreA subunit